MNENIVGAISIVEKGIVDKANVNKKKKKKTQMVFNHIVHLEHKNKGVQ